jgi:hypothetical protein
MDEIGRARTVAATLALCDAGYATLLARRNRGIDAVFGESTGLWRDWGVGFLVGYVGAQTAIAARPSAQAFGHLALLRGLCATGHVAALPVVSPARRPLIVGLLGMNLAATAIGWRARSTMMPRR